MIFNNAKRNNCFILVLILCCLVAIFQGCKKKRSEMSAILFKRTHNPVFKDLDQDEFTAYFKKELEKEKSKINNSQLIIDHYDQNDYEPDFVLYHLWDGGLQAMLSKYRKAYEHGIDPQLFKPDQISALIAKFYTKNAIKSPEEAYEYIAQLEIMSSSTLIDYSSDLQYGMLSPKKIFSRYFIKTRRPDSLSINRVFSVENMQAYLDSIQPKDPEYQILQKAYLDGFVAPKMSTARDASCPAGKHGTFKMEK